MSANYAFVYVQDVLHPSLLSYSFVYSPITLCNNRHVSCSAIQLFHTYTLLNILSLSASSLFSALRETHLNKDLQRTGREGLTCSHWMPMHSKLGLDSFLIFALLIAVLVLSTLTEIGKNQVYLYQILKVIWLSLAAFIWIVASETNLSKWVWYISHFGRKPEFWYH